MNEHDVLRIDVPVDLAALGNVRSEVIAAAHGWGFTRLDDLALIVTEMVANAIVHAGTPSIATCRLGADASIELSVNDRGAGWPTMGTTDDQRMSGRGLLIVDALSTRWGVRPEADGSKTTWARITATAPTEGPA